VQTLVNGEVKQDARTSAMIFSVAHLITFVSRDITLEPGDVILTGTPEGVGPIRAGDVVETRIGDMAPLLNPVANRSRVEPASSTWKRYEYLRRRGMVHRTWFLRHTHVPAASRTALKYLESL
jgi:hypothetical protein